MKGYTVIFAFFSLTFLFLTFTGCGVSVKREIISPTLLKEMDKNRIQKLKNDSPYLKAHMKDGSLYVFEEWDIDKAKMTIYGIATLYDVYRGKVGSGLYTIPLDSVAVFETNDITNARSITNVSLGVLTIITVGSVALTVYCLSNPKACFGSCPTFYVYDENDSNLVAEGFSSSILPSLEATDVDMLYHVKNRTGEISIEMRNEALETHFVRYVNLLVVPRDENTRIFVDNEMNFWRTRNIKPPVSAICPEGDCLEYFIEFDKKERFSLADSSYLGAKEEIELKFKVDEISKPYGLIIGNRQTLLTTFLFYQGLAYAGSNVGYLLAEIERGRFKNTKSQNSIAGILGGIDIFKLNDKGQWDSVGTVLEYGPIASDVHLIPIGVLSTPEVKIKLRMTKGLWRIDYIALAELIERVEPERLYPYVVLKDSLEDKEALLTLLDPEKLLITFPGDKYTLKYKLPEKHGNYEFFLESRGYYLEWMREEWIKEENPFLLAEMIFSPERALKRLAPEFKRIEPQIEEIFWRSRYAKK